LELALVLAEVEQTQALGDRLFDILARACDVGEPTLRCLGQSPTEGDGGIEVAADSLKHPHRTKRPWPIANHRLEYRDSDAGCHVIGRDHLTGRAERGDQLLAARVLYGGQIDLRLLRLPRTGGPDAPGIAFDRFAESMNDRFAQRVAGR